MRDGSEKIEGICKLTKEYGRFVKSHILPKSLTKPSENGHPLMEGTRGKGFKRRWSSWFDSQLVIRKGEDILAKIDDDGIKELRHYQLIWKSWIFYKPNFERLSLLMPDHGIRRVRFRSPNVLRLFVLSILWRAAASSLHEMNQVSISDDKLEKLRMYVCGEQSLLPHEFPISIVQLSTVGQVHNHSPYKTYKETPKVGSCDPELFVIVRIYLDGVIFHVHLDELEGKRHGDNPLILGFTEETIIVSVSYEASFQNENLTVLAYESIFGPLGEIS